MIHPDFGVGEVFATPEQPGAFRAVQLGGEVVVRFAEMQVKRPPGEMRRAIASKALLSRIPPKLHALARKDPAYVPELRANRAQGIDDDLFSPAQGIRLLARFLPRLRPADAMSAAEYGAVLGRDEGWVLERVRSGKLAPVQTLVTTSGERTVFHRIEPDRRISPREASALKGALIGAGASSSQVRERVEVGEDELRAARWGHPVTRRAEARIRLALQEIHEARVSPLGALSTDEAAALASRIASSHFSDPQIATAKDIDREVVEEARRGTCRSAEDRSLIDAALVELERAGAPRGARVSPEQTAFVGRRVRGARARGWSYQLIARLSNEYTSVVSALTSEREHCAQHVFTAVMAGLQRINVLERPIPNLGFTPEGLAAFGARYDQLEMLPREDLPHFFDRAFDTLVSQANAAGYSMNALALVSGSTLRGGGSRTFETGRKLLDGLSAIVGKDPLEVARSQGRAPYLSEAEASALRETLRRRAYRDTQIRAKVGISASGMRLVRLSSGGVRRKTDALLRRALAELEAEGAPRRAPVSRRAFAALVRRKAIVLEAGWSNEVIAGASGVKRDVAHQLTADRDPCEHRIWEAVRGGLKRLQHIGRPFEPPTFTFSLDDIARLRARVDEMEGLPDHLLPLRFIDPLREIIAGARARGIPVLRMARTSGVGAANFEIPPGKRRSLSTVLKMLDGLRLLAGGEP